MEELERINAQSDTIKIGESKINSFVFHWLKRTKSYPVTKKLSNYIIASMNLVAKEQCFSLWTNRFIETVNQMRQTSFRSVTFSLHISIVISKYSLTSLLLWFCAGTKSFQIRRRRYFGSGWELALKREGMMRDEHLFYHIVRALESIVD